MPFVPPIKSQGIKTKLVSWIETNTQGVEYNRWVEPFMGTGVVAFNIRPRKALLCDSNPHLIRFYKALQSKELTYPQVKKFLEVEGKKLLQSGGSHYYEVRERFNEDHAPLDFLFLSRSCFNGLMRFNRKGGFNVPFCKKPNRFAPALVTKITNQVKKISEIIELGNYTFINQPFTETLKQLEQGDIVYADPPYVGRHVDYFDSWSEEEELKLKELLEKSGAKFILSTWLKNKYRTNEHVFSTWAACEAVVREHFYHVGAQESNRNAVYEALLANFSLPEGKSSRELKALLKEEKALCPSPLKEKTQINLFG